MAILPFLLIPVCFVALAVRTYYRLKRNIKTAKEVNVSLRFQNQKIILTHYALQLPYTIMPFYTGTLLWFLIYPVVTPIIQFCLPSSWTRDWIE